MKHRFRVGVLSTIFALFVLPVLIAQLSTPEGRSFHGVKLEDTQYLEISFQNKAHSADVDFIVNVVGASVSPKEQLLFEENHNLREFGLLPGISNIVAYLSTSFIRYLGQREFWDAVGDFDPLPYWENLAIRSIVLYGHEDSNVPSAESAAKLLSLGNPNIEVKIYQHSGHALETPTGHGNSIFREDALADISDFILSASSSPLSAAK